MYYFYFKLINTTNLNIYKKLIRLRSIKCRRKITVHYYMQAKNTLYKAEKTKKNYDAHDYR